MAPRKDPKKSSRKLTQNELLGGGSSSPNTNSSRRRPPPKESRRANASATAPLTTTRNGTEVAEGAEVEEDEDETEEDEGGRLAIGSDDDDGELGDGITEICAVCPGRRCLCHLRDRGSFAGSTRGRGSLPGPVRLRLSRRCAKAYAGSVDKKKKQRQEKQGKESSSSLSPLDGQVTIDVDEDDDGATIALQREEDERWVGSDADDLSSSLDYGSETTAGRRSAAAGAADSDDEGSEEDVGEVYLEFTDFGDNGSGQVVTWSDDESEKDESTEHQGEFAELLLMDQSGHDSDEDARLYLDNLERIAREGSDDLSDADTEERIRLLGFGSGSDDDAFYILEQVPSDEEQDEGEGGDEQAGHDDDDSLTASDDGGATTDSLDEDDHSGLVKFGIETDDPEDGFWDVPEDSQLGAVLRGFEASGSVRFCVVGDDGAPQTIVSASAPPMTPGPICRVPVMGDFDTRETVTLGSGSTLVEDSTPGSTAFHVRTRTIIDQDALAGAGEPVPSPFSGGKVVRYNRFRKLREKEMRKLLLADEPMSGGSAGSTSAQPTPPQVGATLELPGTAEEEEGDEGDEEEEDDFDITAFIRGISSKEVSDTEEDDGIVATGQGFGTSTDPLSRWNRVPMSAFRRNRTASDAIEPFVAAKLDGAFRRSAPMSSPGSGAMKRQPPVVASSQKRKRGAANGGPMLWSSPSVKKSSLDGIVAGGGEIETISSRKVKRALKRAKKNGDRAVVVDGHGNPLDGIGSHAVDAGPASVPPMTTQAPPTEGLLPATVVNTPFFSGVMGGDGPVDVPMLSLDGSV